MSNAFRPEQVSVYPFGFIGPYREDKQDGMADKELRDLCDRYHALNSDDELKHLRTDLLMQAVKYFNPWGGFFHWFQYNLDKAKLSPNAIGMLQDTFEYVRFGKYRSVDMSTWYHLIVADTQPYTTANMNLDKVTLSDSIGDEGLALWISRPQGFDDMVWFLKTVFGTEKA